MRLLHHGVSQYRPDSVLGPARWPHFDLLVVLGGSFIFDLPRVGLTAMAGDALIAPKGVRFCGRASTTGGTIWVHHFRPGKSEAEAWLSRLPKEQMTYYPGGVNENWAQALLARIHEIHPHPELKQEQTTLFKMLLNHISGSSLSQKRSLIHETIRAAKDLQWRGINIAWMAAHAGLSQSHFRARFLAETGETVGDFLMNKRLEWSREMLQTTDTPIKEISRQAGYSEPSAFYHAFRRATGCSPAKFRKRYSSMI